MASLVYRGARRLVPRLNQRWASQAAAVPLTEPVYTPTATQTPTAKEPEDVKLSDIGNGVRVASLENHSHSSHVAVYVRAGSRYETFQQQGLTHLLQYCAYLMSAEQTAFKIMREMDAIGGSLSASATREHFVFSSEFLRGNIDQVVNTLGDVVCSPLFQHWEVNDKKMWMKLDIAAKDTEPNTVVLEALHGAAFRNALTNPLCCPSYNLTKFTNEDLKRFVAEWFTGKRMAVVGVGVDHAELVQCAKSAFSSAPKGVSTCEPSEYMGGSDVRLPSGSPLAHAAIACKGANLNNPKDIAVAGVLQYLLGVTNCIKWGSNSTSRLSKAAGRVMDTPFTVSALNLPYADNGLFGMMIASDGSVAGKLLRTVMKEFADVAKGNISSEDVSRAKNQFKASYLMGTESQAALVEDIGVQVTLRGDYTPVSETLKLADSVTKDDIVKFAKAVFSTRATFVAHGNLSDMPRLDHLLSEVSLK